MFETQKSGNKNNDEIKQYAKHMLGFLHQSLIENKHKVMRSKILHHILPCKTLHCQWKLSDTPTCNFCNAIEYYQHYFLTFKYLNNLWEKVYLISEKVGYSRNIYTLKNMIWGYKIKYTNGKKKQCIAKMLITHKICSG